MKKSGFTLAEVLITLGIVGFIASITIPSLTVSAGNRQAAASFKKAIYTISNAASLSGVMNGVDFSTISKTDEIPTVLNGTASVMTNQEIGIKAGVTPTHTHTNHSNATVSNKAVFFRDGTILLYPATSADVTSAGIKVVIDVNGTKGPNKYYNCTNSSCSQGVKNFDIFPVILKGSSVIPSNHASRWLKQQ